MGTSEHLRLVSCFNRDVPLVLCPRVIGSRPLLTHGCWMGWVLRPHAALCPQLSFHCHPYNREYMFIQRHNFFKFQNHPQKWPYHCRRRSGMRRGGCRGSLHQEAPVPAPAPPPRALPSPHSLPVPQRTPSSHRMRSSRPTLIMREFTSLTQRM